MLLDEYDNQILYLYKKHIYIIEISSIDEINKINESNSIIKISSNIFSIIVDKSSSSNINFGNINLAILEKKYDSNLFITNDNDNMNIHENIGLITNNTTFKIIKNNDNNINPYTITSLNLENNTLYFECIILKADNIKYIVPEKLKKIIIV